MKMEKLNRFENKAVVITGAKRNHRSEVTV